jgi:hypothetical protein
MSQRSSIALAVATVLAGCAGAGSNVTVQRWAEAPAKPPNCAPEILQKAPSRPYDALGDLTSHVTNPPAQGAIHVLLPKACELGADAVIVERNQVLNEFGHVLVSVIAIRWRVTPVEPAVEPVPAGTTAAAPTPEPQTAATTSPPAALPPIQSIPQSGAGSLNPREPNR